PPIDPRIRKVLGIIKADFLAPPLAPELASAVGLSAGRLIHLFTQEMGLPIRRYVLWLRLRDVMFSLAAGHSLTEAAHRAGFADSPHLSRTFRGMFGFPPSAISEGRGRVRIVFDPEAAVAEPGAHPTIDTERLARARPRKADNPGGRDAPQTYRKLRIHRCQSGSEQRARARPPPHWRPGRR